MAFTETQVQIPCCICGVPIQPNPSNMCLACLRENAQIANDVPQSCSVIYCKSCGRYQTGPTHWKHAELESPQLMEICMKKVTGLKDKRVVDAKFLYTEPHSRRFRVSLTLEKDADQNAVLRQTIILTFVVNSVQCPQCVEHATPREHWTANVQIRQNSEHKRGLFWLEQQILKARAHQGTTSIERKDDGVDFHFATKDGAERFVNFLKNYIPMNLRNSAKQVGEDIQNGTLDMRFTYSVRCPPLCRQDFVILPKWLVKKTGNKCHCAVVQRVAKKIHLVDPMSAETITVDGPTYWKNEFLPLCSAKSLRKFNIINIEFCGESKGKYQLADVELTDESYRERILVKTHLGKHLSLEHPCLAYDLRVMVKSNKDEDIIRDYGISDVIIAGKTTERRKTGTMKWVVKELAPRHELDEDDFNEFLDDLENDEDLRKDVDIYINEDAVGKPESVLQETNVDIKEMKTDS